MILVMRFGFLTPFFAQISPVRLPPGPGTDSIVRTPGRNGGGGVWPITRDRSRSQKKVITKRVSFACCLASYVSIYVIDILLYMCVYVYILIHKLIYLHAFIHIHTYKNAGHISVPPYRSKRSIFSPPPMQHTKQVKSVPGLCNPFPLFCFAVDDPPSLRLPGVVPTRGDRTGYGTGVPHLRFPNSPPTLSRPKCERESGRERRSASSLFFKIIFRRF